MQRSRSTGRGFEREANERAERPFGQWLRDAWCRVFWGEQGMFVRIASVGGSKVLRGRGKW